MSDQSDILLIGTEVKPYGIIKAVGWTGGERYYWFEDKHGSVAMMPAYVIEKRPLNEVELWASLAHLEKDLNPNKVMPKDWIPKDYEI